MTLSTLTLNEMDQSTLIVLFTLAAVFVMLRWFIAPIPQSVPEEFDIPDPSRRRTSQSTRQRSRRPVTDSMIEVVQTIAPQLTVSQIRFSLERTGSVETTVNEFMENGDLPFPPGEAAPDSQPAQKQTSRSNRSESLLERYGVTYQDVPEEIPLGTWGLSESERIDLLQKRKADMILKARNRMEKSLKETQ